MKKIIFAFIITIATIIGAYFVAFHIQDITLKRSIWFGSGILGHLMLKKWHPEHYKNRDNFWWLGYILAVIFIAPIWFATGLIAWWIKPFK